MYQHQAMQNAQNQNYAADGLAQTCVATILDLLEVCHKYAADAQDALDRIVGCNPPTPDGISAVSNGAMDSLIEQSRVLRDRLEDVVSRINRIG